ILKELNECVSYEVVKLFLKEEKHVNMSTQDELHESLERFSTAEILSKLNSSRSCKNKSIDAQLILEFDEL
ncbi:23042_t:CDS:1, partial [Gigaspora margarita]